MDNFGISTLNVHQSFWASKPNFFCRSSLPSRCHKYPLFVHVFWFFVEMESDILAHMHQKALQINTIKNSDFNPAHAKVPYSSTVYKSAIGTLKSCDITSFTLFITEKEQALVGAFVHSKLKRKGWYIATITMGCHFKSLFGTKEGKSIFILKQN